MPAGVPDSKSLLWVDGQGVTLTFTRKTLVTAGAFVNGTVYTILSLGTTDFTAIGSPDNIVGTTFTASFVGADPSTGGGTASTPAPGLLGTIGTLTWTLPVNTTTGQVYTTVYDGVLITGSIKEINSSNFPTDSVVYNASPNFTAPADMIGNAQVLGAFYNDKVTVSLNISGLVPNVPYFFSAHAVSNVITYYTPGVRSYPTTDGSTVYAGDMAKDDGPPTSPTLGQVYFDLVQRLVFVWDGTAWVPTSPSNVLTNAFDPIPGQAGLPVGYPVLGDFFYNTTEQVLKCWNGTVWNPVESEEGVPMYEKEGVGTDLTSSARDKMIDVLKKQFGWPVVCVELIPDHYNVAIDNALQELRHRTDSAYNKRYFFMQIQQFQDIYYLNDPSLDTDKIVDVLKIHRLNMLGLVNFAPDNIYAQQFLNQFYAPGVSYDLVSIHLIAAMSETFSLLFAGEVTFNWREATRELRIYKKFGTPEKVLIECSMEKTEQELLTDRWVAQWIQNWAKSVCCQMLGNIRGKYQTLPGPGGGLTMNADILMAEGERLQTECLRQIMDFEIGQNGPDNFYLPFMVG